MYLKTINRGSPEVVVSACLNKMSTSLMVGDAVLWDGTITTATTGTLTVDGFGVTVGATATTLHPSWGMFAGLVINKPIFPGTVGEILMYGIHNAAYFTMGATAAGPFGDFTAWTAATTLTWGDLNKVILRPINAGGGSAQGSATRGLLCPIEYLATLSASGGDSIRYRPGGYAIPLGNPSATVATTSSARVKVFVKALG